MNHLFTDDNPETTLVGLGFKNVEKTLESIAKIEDYFDRLEQQQPLNAWTSNRTRPKEFIKNSIDCHKYYQKQKMYRILGLLNRAKVIYSKNGNPEIKESIVLLNEWMKQYKINKKIEN